MRLGGRPAGGLGGRPPFGRPAGVRPAGGRVRERAGWRPSVRAGWRPVRAAGRPAGWRGGCEGGRAAGRTAERASGSGRAVAGGVGGVGGAGGVGGVGGRSAERAGQNSENRKATSSPSLPGHGGTPSSWAASPNLSLHMPRPCSPCPAPGSVSTSGGDVGRSISAKDKEGRRYRGSGAGGVGWRWPACRPTWPTDRRPVFHALSTEEAHVSQTRLPSAFCRIVLPWRTGPPCP